MSEVLVNSMPESALCQGAFLLGDISFHEACTTSPTPQPEVSGPLWPAFPHLCNLQVDQRAPFLKGHSSNRHKCWEKKKEEKTRKGGTVVFHQKLRSYCLRSTIILSPTKRENASQSGKEGFLSSVEEHIPSSDMSKCGWGVIENMA